jgi:hypothetical protein
MSCTRRGCFCPEVKIEFVNCFRLCSKCLEEFKKEVNPIIYRALLDFLDKCPTPDILKKLIEEENK